MSNRLPKLRPIDYGKKVLKYKLSDTEEKRHKAINSGIKARFNILRIYRQYLKKGECQKITKDMRYIDKKYIKNGTTKNVC